MSSDLISIPSLVSLSRKLSKHAHSSDPKRKPRYPVPIYLGPFSPRRNKFAGSRIQVFTMPDPHQPIESTRCNQTKMSKRNSFETRRLPFTFDQKNLSMIMIIRSKWKDKSFEMEERMVCFLHTWEVSFAGDHWYRYGSSCASLNLPCVPLPSHPLRV